MAKTGVLLINLGTTEAPTEEKVRSYLSEFLMDKRVIDIPYVFRWLLVHGFILRTRPARIAELYKKVWLPEGSPLLHFSRKFEMAFKEAMGADFEVVLGMRYGRPSLAEAVEKLRGVGRLIVFPLYPQYSLAATESSIVRVREILKSVSTFEGVPVTFVESFYNDSGFINAFTSVAAPFVKKDYDHVLFSFHGLPERHVRKTEALKGYCVFDDNCCAKVTAENKSCYRAQCFATATAIARGLGLDSERYSVGFQSRLGRTPWIRPHSDVLYGDLPKKGVKKLLVVSPSFVADCLETVDEIALRGQDQFSAAGGSELTLVPSLNFNSDWIQAAKRIVLNSLKN